MHYKDPTLKCRFNKELHRKLISNKLWNDQKMLISAIECVYLKGKVYLPLASSLYICDVIYCLCNNIFDLI